MEKLLATFMKKFLQKTPDLQVKRATFYCYMKALSAYSGVSGRRNRNYPDTKPEHPETLSIGSILF